MSLLREPWGCWAAALHGAVSSELALVSSLRTKDSLESGGLEEQGSKATSTTLTTQSADQSLAG